MCEVGIVGEIRNDIIDLVNSGVDKYTLAYYLNFIVVSQKGSYNSVQRASFIAAVDLADSGEREMCDRVSYAKGMTLCLTPRPDDLRYDFSDVELKEVSEQSAEAVLRKIFAPAHIMWPDGSSAIISMRNYNECSHVYYQVVVIRLIKYISMSSCYLAKAVLPLIDNDLYKSDDFCDGEPPMILAGGDEVPELEEQSDVAAYINQASKHRVITRETFTRLETELSFDAAVQAIQSAETVDDILKFDEQ